MGKTWPGIKSKNVFFAGCTASYVENDIGKASVTLLDAAGADTVICSCPACDMMWRHTYPEWAKKLGIKYGFMVKHYSEVVAEKIRNGEFTFPNPVEKRVTWHDSCHIGRVSGVYDEPREVIKAIPGVEFVEMPFHHDEAHCCGSVLTLIKEPLVAYEVGKTRLDEAEEVNAEAVLALCPCCQFQFRVTKDKKKLPVELNDLAAFACRSLGMTPLERLPRRGASRDPRSGPIGVFHPLPFAQDEKSGDIRGISSPRPELV